MRWSLYILGVCAYFAHYALTSAEVPPSATGNQLISAITSQGDEQIKVFSDLADSAEPERVSKVLTAWKKSDLYIEQQPDGSKIIYYIDQDQCFRVDTNEKFKGKSTTSIETEPRVRKLIASTLLKLALSDPVPASRISAAMKLGNTQKVDYLPLLKKRLTTEKDSQVQRKIKEAIAFIELNDADPVKKLKAVKDLEALNSISGRDLLAQLNKDTSSSELKIAINKALVSIKSYIAWTDFVATLFRGLSTGSVLLISAIGLAITFGLMGVINMAHGELIAVGAYTVYETQSLFQYLFGKAGIESYFLFAIPSAFLSAALTGLIMERLIIRFLYRRPLESLLATWGVSLVMQQMFRFIFGSNNVDVDSPKWLAHSFTVYDITFEYNRLFLIGFAAFIIIMTWLLLTRTPLGLLIRAVMQNRDMAACVGVRTDQVNMMTFAFGSGLAGLAGAFLSQIGSVGPGLGQTYIVDCFMTVVVGGVGNLFGTVYSAVGIGIVDQSLQQMLQNPVLGKITVLVLIILFLQWKPGGLFPTRGRGLEF